MMTYLTPFERTGYDLFRSMRDWENEFFGGKSAAMSSCKTDIREKAKDGTYLRRERSTSSYEQKLDISNVDASGLHAVYENGVLTLTMPKKQPAKPVSRQLEIH